MATGEIVEFVVRHSASIGLRELDGIIKAIPQMEERLEKPDVKGYAQMAEHYRFLAAVIRDFRDGKFDELSYVGAAEAAFAVSYLVREVDLIPDFVPEVGLVDDATVAIVVLQRHEGVLKKHPMAETLDWSALQS